MLSPENLPSIKELDDRFKAERETLLLLVDRMPLPYRKHLASYYPDAVVRREYLKSIGVIFADESSFANTGFTIIPNTPSDVHVYIGKNVSIAPNVTCICDSSANNGNEINQTSYVIQHAARHENIYIEDEVWVGANAVIMPGVTLGRCSIVGAGSVVTHDTEAYSVNVGVPARKIKDIRDINELK